MKIYQISLILALLGSTFLPAQEVELDENGMPVAAPSVANYTPSRMIEMRPADKSPLITKANERNPYARRSAADEARANGEENQEEIQIRQKLSTLSVKGRSIGPNGPRILLGDIILEKGKELPPLLQQQVESLKVIDISDNSIILGWLDVESRELTGKTMQVTYDLTPRITYALHGQGPRTGDSNEEQPEQLFGTMILRNGTMQTASEVSGQASVTEPE
ncbi:hypothetical protein VSU19_08405 [Verrucomicrobiales bacterium BCK34]|nr:hypothetical protein [Verrucomicrobiales bacterium BCK34]